MAEERIAEPDHQADDQALDVTLRPKTFADYIGQSKIKQNLEIFVTAAQQRGEALEHLLFYGPPGLGKTTLAHIIAQQMKAPIKVISGPAIERVGDLAAILSNLQPGEVLFIDEIHRLNHLIEEMLYPAMEDYVLDIVIGKGPTAQTIRLDLARFTLIGATTRLDLLTGPLRDRFGGVHRLEFYAPEDIEKIITRSARILGIKLEPGAAAIIAQRARRTPRVANRLLKRVRDYAQVKHGGKATPQIAEEALNLLDVDPAGLDALDRKLLRFIIEQHQGGPVGLNTLAAALSEEMATIEDVVEPFLLQQGFLARTPRGRTATAQAYQHLGLQQKPGGLFS